MLKNVLKVFSLFFVGILTLVILMNLKDQELNPEIMNLLEREFEDADENIVIATKWSLGLLAPYDFDQFEYGTKKYNQIKSYLKVDDSNDLAIPEFRYNCQSAICTQEELQKFESEFKSSQQFIKTINNRFLKAMEFKDVGISFKVRLDSLHTLSYLPHFKIFKLLLFKWNQEIYSKSSKFDVQDILKSRDYFYNSLSKSQTTLDGLISLSIVNACDEFLDSAVSKGLIELSKLNFVRNKDHTVNFNQVFKSLTEIEMIAMSQALEKLDNFEFLSSFDGENIKYEVPFWVIKILTKTMYLPNETINNYYQQIKLIQEIPCIKNEESCEGSFFTPAWYSYIRNPLGKYIVKMLSGNWPNLVKKIHIQLEKMNKRYD